MPDLGAQWRQALEGLSAMRIIELWDNMLWKIMGIAVACLVVTMVGLLDDLMSLSPRKKIVGQVLAAAILFAGGLGVRMATVFFSPFGWQAPLEVVIPVSAVLCVVTVVFACNATNLLDGLDGLCGGVTGIIAMGFLLLAVWLAMWDQFPGTDQVRVVLCLAMIGAILGFLPYNVPPATIFMGDAGSMLLGFFVATMMAMFCRQGYARWFLAALAVFALPILDTALAVVRRAIAGRSIFEGDRGHLYDQLVDRGISVRRVVALFYALALASAAIGVGTAVFIRTKTALVIYAAVFAAIWLFFWKGGFLKPPEKRESKPEE
jgi:UDP-GlcNAc:undecaprenyl-phosphate GlcNAc-1-phosphate transferase